MGNEVYAIVPAKGSSSRFPNKNIREFNGKPLIVYTIERLQATGIFSKIFVNSDDEHILDVAKVNDAFPYPRPGYLCSSDIKVLQVFQEQGRSLDWSENQEIGLILPTCPLTSLDDYLGGYKLFAKNDKQNPVVSVTKFEKAPDQALNIDAYGQLYPKYPESYSSMAQHHETSYWYNTAFIFTTNKLLQNKEDIVGTNSLPYVMPYIRAIDIDYEYQLEIAKAIHFYNTYKESDI